MNLEGAVAKQIKGLRAGTEPEPEFNFITYAQKAYFNFAMSEKSDNRFFHIEFGLADEYPTVAYMRPGKDSFAFRCKRFYLIEYEGE